uniref:Pecanex-like protein n=1 Tax=Mesocestoides corti TaxID=53468 RepID=A0A5K3FU36_MESCO
PPILSTISTAFSLTIDPLVDVDITFTVVIHKDIRQITRICWIIYRQINYHYIHTNRRSDCLFIEDLRHVAACFDANVEFLPCEETTAVEFE